jgi:hypothetical protein
VGQWWMAARVDRKARGTQDDDDLTLLRTG